LATFGLLFLFRRDLVGCFDFSDHCGAGQAFHVMAGPAGENGAQFRT